MVDLPSNDEWPNGWRYSQKRGDYFVLTYDLHEHHVLKTGVDGWKVEYKYNGKPNGSMSARTSPENGFEVLKRDLYNNFLASKDWIPRRSKSMLVLFECRNCGKAVEASTHECPSCGSHEIARYEIEE